MHSLNALKFQCILRNENLALMTRQRRRPYEWVELAYKKRVLWILVIERGKTVSRE